MNSVDVIRAMECQGKPVIRHIKSGDKYYLKGILRVKVVGGWSLGATYYNEKGLFCRCVDDFTGFNYLHNEAPYFYGDQL
jgi:hypothetical protein|tara:strand:- start:13444 stop:13683 length:240 start_codon:yes stop_codon:yes gene_type:complete